MPNYLQKLTILMLFLFLLPSFSFAQNIDFPKPREEKLLNDLKELIWSKRDSNTVTVKLRIHSGSAFDPKDKMGVMALLGDILFPEEGLKKFFEEDLGGKLEVISNYDYVQINATAKTSEFLTILETIAPAVINPTINKTTTAKVKAKRLEFVKSLKNDPSYMANRAVAKRLLGDFPYGRPQEGTEESISKIDFADLVFAEQRFLTSDNATLAIIGNVRSDFAYRAARRLFGGWGKRTEKIPSSFLLPGNPDVKPEIIKAVGNRETEFHYAVNGFPRNDNEYFASKVLEKVLSNRLFDLSKKDGDVSKASVKQQSHLLRGLFFFDWRSLDKANINLVATLLNSRITQTEFEKARSETLFELAKKDFANFWLDIDTFRLESVKAEIKKAGSVKIEEVRNIAIFLKKEPVTQAIVSFQKGTPSIKQDLDPKDPQK